MPEAPWNHLSRRDASVPQHPRILLPAQLPRRDRPPRTRHDVLSSPTQRTIRSRTPHKPSFRRVIINHRRRRQTNERSHGPRTRRSFSLCQLAAVLSDVWQWRCSCHSDAYVSTRPAFRYEWRDCATRHGRCEWRQSPTSTPHSAPAESRPSRSEWYTRHVACAHREFVSRRCLIFIRRGRSPYERKRKLYRRRI